MPIALPIVLPIVLPIDWCGRRIANPAKHCPLHSVANLPRDSNTQSTSVASAAGPSGGRLGCAASILNMQIYTNLYEFI